MEALSTLETPPSAWIFRYSAQDDILQMRIGEPRSGVDLDITDELMAQVAFDSNQLIGFEILRFERQFLAGHPKVTSPWRRAKPQLASGSVVLGNHIPVFFAAILQVLRAEILAHPDRIRIETTV
jgi:hypothetical protein